MATVNLGSIKFKWKGTYAGGTAYTIDDVVSYNGSSYICIQASTGNLPTDTAYFEQMSQKGTDGTNGTDGTDLGTTLTTQGDIVYRDGSGLQRLGAGTSGQVLQTNGTGANPSWGTVSSDFVLLSTDEITSSTASISRDVFNSTYESYKVIMNGISPTSASNSNLYFRIRRSGSDVTNSEYYSHGQQGYWNNSTNGSGAHNEVWAGNYGLIYARNHHINRGGNYEFTIYNTQNDRNVHLVGIGGLYDEDAYHRHVRFSSWHNSTATVDGIKIYFQGQNIGKANVKIYGIK